MQIKATQFFCKWLQENLKEDKKFEGYKVKLEKLTPQSFDWYVGDFVFEDFVDLNKDNLFKVVRIIYPNDFWACDKFLTTRTLNKIFNNSNKTEQGFLQAIKEEIEA